MHRVRSWIPTLLATAIGVASLGAQDAAAQHLRPLLGRVLDADGAPLVGAEVHCVLPDETAPGNRAASHVVVKTDARGRFRTKVVPCTHHLIWAIGPDGEQRVCSVPQWTASGRLVELRADRPRPACKVTVSGLDAWQDKAPFRLRTALEGVELPDSEVPLEAGACTLAAPPAGSVQLDLLDRDGEPLASFWERSLGSSRQLALHPPKEIPIVAVDEAGAPVAGARVRYEISAGSTTTAGYTVSLPRRRIWLELGETDDQGRLLARISSRYDPFVSKRSSTMLFLAEKRGRRLSHSGFWQGPYHDGRKVEMEGCRELRFTLPSVEPRTVRLRGGPERGLAQQPALLRMGVRVLNADGKGWVSQELLFAVRADEDGRIEVPQLTGEVDEVDLLLAGGGARERLAPESLLRRTPQRAVSLHSVSDLDKQPTEFDLGGLCVLDLQLLDATGGPANDFEMLFLSCKPDRRALCDDWTTRAATDSAGRVSVLLQPGKWFVFGRNERDMVQLSLTIERDEQRELRTQPMPAMRGRVVDEEGKPVADASLSVYSSSAGGNRDTPALNAIAGRLNWSWIGSVRSDADGSFFCAFLDLPHRSYKGKFRFENRSSGGFRIEATEEPLTITIEDNK